MTPDHIQSLAQLAAQSLLNSLPEGFLVALFAWATLRLVPKQNSRSRFAVWFLALMAVVALPLFEALMPSGLNQGPVLGTSVGGTGALPRPLASARIPFAIGLPAHWAPYIFLVWSLAALVILMRLAVGLWRLRELRQSCTPLEAAKLDPTLAQTIAELTSIGFFVREPATIATSERVRVPAALGLGKPMIVLPTWALRELPPADLSIILRHEFAHLQRWDDWTNLVQKIVRALFFFHPAVWWIESRLSVEREMACDEVVVAQTDNPTGYASCLISLLERGLAGRGWTMAQALVHRAREASLRLAQILDMNRPAATRVSKPALGLVSVFTLLCLVALPRTPQVVAFEQDPQRIAADHEYSAALAKPAMMRSSFAHPAMFLPRGGAETSLGSVAAIPAMLDSANPAPKGQHALAHDVTPGSERAKEMSPVGTPQVLAQTLQTCDQTAGKPCGSSRQGDARATEPGGESAGASTIAVALDSVIQVNAFADQKIQPLLPTLVFFQTTRYVESDSGSHYVVWRIQVWRLGVVNPVWKHKAQAPPAHST